MSTIKAMRTEEPVAAPRKRTPLECVVVSFMSQTEAAGAGARYLARLRSKALKAMEDGYEFGKSVVGYVSKTAMILDLPLADVEASAIDCDRLVASLERVRHTHERLLGSVRKELALCNPVLAGIDRTLIEQSDRLRDAIAAVESKVAQAAVPNTTSALSPSPSANAAPSELRVLAGRVVKQMKARGKQDEDIDRWAETLAGSATGAQD